MGREVKRVPSGFSPQKTTWFGYILPPIPCELCRGKTKDCKLCYGEGIVWPKLEVPEGKAYQMWETTSEGSPISPTFDTPEELALWLADNDASACGNQPASYGEWLRMILAGSCPTMIATQNEDGTGTIQSGVSAS